MISTISFAPSPSFVVERAVPKAASVSDVFPDVGPPRHTVAWGAPPPLPAQVQAKAALINAHGALAHLAPSAAEQIAQAKAQAAAKAREQSNKLLGVPTYNRQAYEQAAVHYDKDGKLSISPLRAKMSNRTLGLRPSTPPEDQPLSPRVLDLHPVDHRDNLRQIGRAHV